MDFLYQAIRKATGVEEPPAKQAAADVFPEIATALSELKAAQTPSLPADRPKKSALGRKSFDVKHPVDNLVAFLSHPVLEPNIAAMEQCRIIRTRLRELAQTKHIRTVMITSALQGEGKTTMAVNLAYALSQLEGMKILLVDSDLRRPYVSSFLKMGHPSGLDKYLLEKESFADVCWRLTPSLDVVATGQLSDDSAELLHGTRMREFLAEASAAYSLVLLDAPPLFPIVDAQVLANLVDAAILVVRAHATSHNGYYERYGYKGKKIKT